MELFTSRRKPELKSVGNLAWAAVLMMSAALMSGGAPDGGAILKVRQLAAAEETESTRERILRHLTEIHSSDPEVEEAAWESLRKLRISDEQLELARLLKHPDRLERLRLAGLLDSATEPLRTELQLELTKDSDRDVRELVLRRLSKVGIPTRIASRLHEMVESDPDSQIRELAATLLPAQTLRQASAVVRGDFCRRMTRSAFHRLRDLANSLPNLDDFRLRISMHSFATLRI